MTVAELIEALEDVRGDMPVKIVKSGKQDIAFEIFHVGYYGDTDFVQIEMADGGEVIR